MLWELFSKFNIEENITGGKKSVMVASSLPKLQNWNKVQKSEKENIRKFVDIIPIYEKQLEEEKVIHSRPTGRMSMAKVEYLPMTQTSRLHSEEENSFKNILRVKLLAHNPSNREYTVEIVY